LYPKLSVYLLANTLPMQFSRAQLLVTSEIGASPELADWLTLTLGGVDSLGGVSPQWQHPSNIRRSLTMLSRPDNRPRIAAIRRRSFQPCHMCQRQR
jgi:hypothetical protein